MLVRRAAQSTITIAPLVDRRAARSSDERTRRSTRALVDRRETSALVDRDHRSRRSSAQCDRWTSGAIVDRAAHRRGAIVDRAARRRGASVDRVARRRGAARSGLSLLSLSLSFSGSDLK